MTKLEKLVYNSMSTVVLLTLIIDISIDTGPLARENGAIFYIREDFMIKTSKQRAYLKGLAMNLTPIFQIGKSSLTPELTAAVAEALEARELIKISVLQNCLDDPKVIAQYLAERTRSEVVQVIGKKIVLYKEGKDNKKKIVLPE